MLLQLQQQESHTSWLNKMSGWGKLLISNSLLFIRYPRKKKKKNFFRFNRIFIITFISFLAGPTT
jgi:hypothetical protein